MYKKLLLIKKNIIYLCNKYRLNKITKLIISDSFSYYSNRIFLFLNKRFFLKKNAIFSNIQPNINKKLLLICVAFNNLDTIKFQNNYLEQNLEDTYTYIIADNSNNKQKSEEIKKYCLSEEIKYVKIPKNMFDGNPSYSHGMALNWIYKNIIKKIKPKYFGFIDHDIYPIKKTKLLPLLNEHSMFGLIQDRDNGWYLWAGFCFYNFNIIKNYKLDFTPYFGLDTGGSNYYSLYKKIDKNLLPKISLQYFDIIKEKILNESEVTEQNETVHIMHSDWLHLMNTSNYNGKNPNKVAQLNEIVEKYLKYQS